jgi:hypothetical protein
MNSTLSVATKLVRSIREAMSGAPGLDHAQLAAEYARLCREAVQRIEQCATMIEKGSDYQALQLAESEPILLDLIAALSFSEAPQWIETCTAQELPVPPKFDTKAVQALNALYTKGITANHPLYKDYRGAVTARDDVKALRIIRTIARLNAGDANAQSELQRLENKFYQLALAEMRAALTAQDETRTLHALDEVERLGSPDKLAELPDYARALDVRRVVQRREAIALSERLVDSLDGDRAAGAWRVAGDTLTRLRGLQTEHGFSLPTAAGTKCAEVQTWVDAQQREADAVQHFQTTMKNAAALAEEAETRLLTRTTLTLDETEKLYAEFSRRWRAVEQCQRTVPEDFVARVRRGADTLRGELDRLRRQRRIRFTLAAAAALIVCSVGAFFAIRAYRVHDFAGQLATLRSKGEVEAAEKLVQRLRAESPTLVERPALRSRIDEVTAWAASERATLSQEDAQLADLEAATKAGFASSDPAKLATQLQSASELLERLSPGLRDTPAARLAVVRNEVDAHFTKERDTLTRDAEAQLAPAENIAATQLGYDREEPAMRAALEQIEPVLKALESRAQPSVEALALPATLQTRVRALRQRVDLFRDELTLLANTHEQLVQSTTLADYQRALAGFDKSRLVQAGAVGDARKLGAAFPKPDEILAALLLPDDPVGWAAAKADQSESGLMPAKVLDAELSKLVGLRDDKNIGNIWEATLVQGKRGGRPLYSRGPIEERRGGTFEGVQNVEWTGSFYDPTNSPGGIAFLPTATYRTSALSNDGVSIKNIRRSAATLALEKLALERMTDTAGSRYERPLLRAFDDLVTLKDTSPAVKAVFWQQLADVLNLRPYEWGLQYCASLRRDLAEFTRLLDGATVGTGDWMIPTRADDLGKRLGPFFKGLDGRGYQAEARLHRGLVRAVLKAGLQYGGFVDGAGRAHMLGEARASGEVWGLAVDPKTKIARLTPPADGKDTDAPGLARFTPLFFVPLDRQTVLAELTQKARGLSAAPAKVPVIPFLSKP